MVSIYAVIGLYVANDWFGGRSSLHLAADHRGDLPGLSADPHPELVRVLVAAIALVDVDAARLDAAEPRHLGEDRAERMAVEWNAVQRFGMQHGLDLVGALALLCPCTPSSGACRKEIDLVTALACARSRSGVK